MNPAVIAFALCAHFVLPPTSDPAPTAELSVEAGVLTRNGDIQKVARTPLVLLKGDVAAKLMEVYTEGVNTPRVKANVYILTKRHIERGGSPGGDLATKVQQVDEFIMSNTVATATTDSDGKATIQAPPGDYYLHAHFELGKDIAFWSVPVKLNPGRNEITLDHNNTVR